MRALSVCLISVKIMDKQEYLKEVTKYIQSKKQMESALRELSEHFEDRKQYFLDAGFDENTAEQKTIESMGEAELIGTRLGKVHGRSFFVPLLIVQIVLGLISSFIGAVFAVLYCNTPFQYSLVRIESLLLLFLCVFAYIGLRYRYKSIFTIAYIPYFLFLIPKWIICFTSFEKFIEVRCSSGFVWNTIYLLLAKKKQIYIISTHVWEMQVAWWLRALSILFYVGIIFTFIGGMVFLIKENHYKTTLKQKRLFKHIQKGLIGLGLVVLLSMAVTIAVFAVTRANEAADANNYSSNCVYAKGINQNEELWKMEGSYVQDETDELDIIITDYVLQSSIHSVKNIQLYGTGEGGKPEKRWEKVRFDENFEYYVVVYDVKVVTTKDYIYFSNRGLWENFDQSKWIPVKKGETYRVAFKTEEYPINFVQFTIQ